MNKETLTSFFNIKNNPQHIFLFLIIFSSVIVTLLINFLLEGNEINKIYLALHLSGWAQGISAILLMIFVFYSFKKLIIFKTSIINKVLFSLFSLGIIILGIYTFQELAFFKCNPSSYPICEMFLGLGIMSIIIWDVAIFFYFLYYWYLFLKEQKKNVELFCSVPPQNAF